MIVGCYILDLYCDNEPHYHAGLRISGKNANDCYRKARKSGWLIKMNKTIAICPNCKESTKRDNKT